MGVVATRFCTHCGNENTTSAIASQPIRRSRVKRNIWIGAICTVFALLMIAGANQQHTSDTPAPSQSATTKFGCVCAVELEDVGLVLRAYSNSDVRALYGLISRGKAIELEQGVKIHVGTRDNGIAGALVESGVHTGEHCWLPERSIDSN
jgi:hypothetical protein